MTTDVTRALVCTHATHRKWGKQSIYMHNRRIKACSSLQTHYSPPSHRSDTLCSNSSERRPSRVKHNYLASICPHLSFTLFCIFAHIHKSTHIHIITHAETTNIWCVLLSSPPCLHSRPSDSGVSCCCNHHTDHPPSTLEAIHTILLPLFTNPPVIT